MASDGHGTCQRQQIYHSENVDALWCVTATGWCHNKGFLRCLHRVAHWTLMPMSVLCGVWGSTNDDVHMRGPTAFTALMEDKTPLLSTCPDA